MLFPHVSNMPILTYNCVSSVVVKTAVSWNWTLCIIYLSFETQKLSYVINYCY